jgi:hypothetical protein
MTRPWFQPAIQYLATESTALLQVLRDPLEVREHFLLG